MGIQNTPVFTLKNNVISFNGVSQEDIKQLSKLQTNYKGNKSEFFELNTQTIQNITNTLNDYKINVIIDQYSGGGTFGLSFCHLIPSVDYIIINEISQYRKHVLINNLRHGDEWLDKYTIDTEIVEILTLSERLMESYCSITVVIDCLKEGIFQDGTKSLKWVGLKKEIFELVRVLNFDKKVFLLSLCDTASKQKLSIDKLISKTRHNSNIVKQHTQDFLSRGGVVEVVSIDSLSDEMTELCKKHKNSLILSDPPYFQGSKGCYKTEKMKLDFHSLDFVKYNLSILKEQSKNNFLIYHNKQTHEVINELKQYDGMNIKYWTRKIRGDRFDCSEVIGIFDGINTKKMTLEVKKPLNNFKFRQQDERETNILKMFVS